MKKYYTITLQIGLILSLSLFIVLFNYDFKTKQEENVVMFETQEVVQMEEVEITKQVDLPPPPPRPVVPVAVPNSSVIEDEIIDFSVDLDLDVPLELPPPPPDNTVEKEEEEIFVVVEQMPEIIGGMESVYQKIEYPEIARMAGIEGRVIVNFIIDEKGNTVNPKILRGIGGGCDDEALRVVKMLKFAPGRQRGMPVKVNYTLPILFKIKQNQ